MKNRWKKINEQLINLCEKIIVAHDNNQEDAKDYCLDMMPLTEELKKVLQNLK